MRKASKNVMMKGRASGTDRLFCHAGGREEPRRASQKRVFRFFFRSNVFTAALRAMGTS